MVDSTQTICYTKRVAEKEKMKVWVLVGIFANRSHSVLGVYATREEAQEDQAEFGHQANYESFMLTRHYVKDSEYFYENSDEV